MHIKINRTNFQTIFRQFILLILLFLFLFEITIYSFLTTRRLVVIVLIVYCLFHKNKIKKMLNNCDIKNNLMFIIISLIILSIYISIINLAYGAFDNINNEYLTALNFLYIFLYVIFASVLFAQIFHTLLEFCQVISIIMVIQAIFIYASVINKDIRQYVYNFLYTDDGRFLNSIESGTRVVGIQLGGAAGSVALSCGLICCLLLMIYIEFKPKYFLTYIIILGATFFVGRTGFYIGVLLLLSYLILLFKDHITLKKIMFLCIIILGVYFFYQISIKNGIIDEYILNRYLTWATEIFSNYNGNNTIIILMNMKIPPLSFETFFGTGVLRGTSYLGSWVQNDSGYIKSYFSMGLLMSIFFYLSIIFNSFKIISKIKKRKTKNLFYLFLIILIFIEFKEPFIFRYIYLFIIITGSVLVIKNESQK